MNSYDEEEQEEVVEMPPIELRAPRPDWRSYLANKYQEQGLGDEKRAELEGKVKEVEPAGWRKSLMAVGAAAGGRDPGRAVDSLYEEQRMAKNDLKNFDDRRGRVVSDYDQERRFKSAQREDEDLSRERDPNSDESKLAQDLAKSMGYKGNISTLTAEQWKKFSPAMQKKYEIEQRRLDKANEAKTKKDEGRTEGQKVVDKEFAKDYNEWNSRGRATVNKNLDRLRTAKAKLEERKKDWFGTSGRVTGRLPEALRSEESLTLQQDVQAAAQGALKATLGAQFTEKEGERIMKSSYDPKLSPEENIKKIDAAIKELEENTHSNEDRSKYFEENGSLKGWVSPKGAQPVSQGPKPGDEEDGYRFKGGDPKDPKNWEPI